MVDKKVNPDDGILNAMFLEIQVEHSRKVNQFLHLPQVSKCPTLSGLRILKIHIKSLLSNLKVGLR